MQLFVVGHMLCLVCLSVCLSDCVALNFLQLQKRRHRKIKIGENVFNDVSNWCYRFKR